MSKTIEEIKEEFAIGEGYESYLDLAFSGNYYAKHSDSEDTINELMVRYAQSKTKELQEQNAELVEMIEHIFYKTNFQRHFPTTSIKVKNLLAKYNHLNKKQ